MWHGYLANFCSSVIFFTNGFFFIAGNDTFSFPIIRTSLMKKSRAFSNIITPDALKAIAACSYFSGKICRKWYTLYTSGSNFISAISFVMEEYSAAISEIVDSGLNFRLNIRSNNITVFVLPESSKCSFNCWKASRQVHTCVHLCVMSNNLSVTRILIKFSAFRSLFFHAPYLAVSTGRSLLTTPHKSCRSRHGFSFAD